MVEIKDEGGELVFCLNNGSNFKPVGDIVRISPEAQAVIDEIRAETGLSAMAIASKLITFGGAHYSIRKE